MFLNVKYEELKLAFLLLALLAINTLVLELADVVATAGFVSNIGPSQLPWLWIVSMVITISAVGAYATIVDQMARVRLVSWLILLLAGSYFGLQLLFIFDVFPRLAYPLLYVLSDLQLAVFPLAFWAMISDVYTMSQAKRIFPFIAAGGMLGSVVGNSLGAGTVLVFTTESDSAIQSLTLMVVALILGFILLRATFWRREVRARQSRHEKPNMKETLQVGLDYVKNVPLFRYMALAMLFVGLAFTLIEYHFLFTIDQAFTGDPLRFQGFYGAYKVVLILVTILFQWFITGRYLEKVGIKNTFIWMPAVLVAAAVGALAVPGLVGGAGARFAGRLIQRAWDEPARKATQNLIPDERRGRVSAFMDSYFYSLSTIVGCLILGVLLIAGQWGLLTVAVLIPLYLVLAGLASVGGVWAAWRMRAVYDRSLLNWRFSRSRRRSVLDGIEF